MTLGNFGRNRKIEKRKFYLTEKQLSRNAIVRHTIAVIYVTCHIFAKGFLDSNFKQVFVNITFSRNGNWKQIDQLFLLREEI